MRTQRIFKLVRPLWIMIIMLLILLSACQKESGIDKEVSFRELGINGSDCGIQNISEEGIVSIFNKEQLARYNTCKEIQKGVDFNREFVVIGRVNLPSYPSRLVSQDIEIKDKDLNYIVRIEMGVAAQPSSVYFIGVVSKKYSHSKIKLVSLIN